MSQKSCHSAFQILKSCYIELRIYRSSIGIGIVKLLND